MMSSIPHELHEQIHREHEELRELLGRVHLLLTARVAAAADVRSCMASLREQIEGHFRDEEVEGFFEQIVDQAPRLDSRVDELRAEHAQLRSDVIKLGELANGDESGDGWWERLERGFHDFSRTLMHHETKENELLQAAYGEDIGSQD